jgi:hypothetical protein
MSKNTEIVLTASDKTAAAFASVKSGLTGLGGVASSLNGALATVGLGATFGGLAAFVKGTIDAADNMRDLAIATGTSVNSLARYELMAKQSGTTLEDVAKSMGRLSVFMARNADESAALGITARDPAMAFAQLADALVKVKDPAERNALAMQVLGKSYAQVMPLLSQSGDEIRRQAQEAGPYAERMERMAEDADKFNDSLEGIKRSASQAGISIATVLLPSLNDTAEAMEKFAKQGQPVMALLRGYVGLGKLPFDLAISEPDTSIAGQVKELNFELGALKRHRKDAEGAGLLHKWLYGSKDDLDRKILVTRNQIEALTKYADKLRPEAASETPAPAEVIDEEGAAKLQKNLAKAFDPMPLDDFLTKLQGGRQRIVAEFAKLKADLTGTTGEAGATYTDFSVNITRGREAMARGDAAGASAAVDLAKATLTNYREGGGDAMVAGHLSDQLKEFALGLADAQERTAQAAVDGIRKGMDLAASEVARMDPLVVPLASEAIANDLRATLAAVQRELEANPLRVPVVATSPRGIHAGASSDIYHELRLSALKVGSR